MPPKKPAMILPGAAVARLATRTHSPVFVRAMSTPGVAVAAPAVAPLTHAVAVTAAPARAALTPRIQDLKLIDPVVSSRISLIPFLRAQGVPRAQITVPLTTSETISEETIFEDAADPAKKFFVMAYAIGEESTTRGKQFAVRLLTNPDGWELAVTIEQSAPPAILAAHPSAQELPHQVALLLRYKQRVNGVPSAVAEAAFTQTTIDGDTVRGTLAVPTIAKRDELYHALTDPELACTLVVRRKVRVGVPAPGPRHSGPVAPAAPTGVRIATLAVRPAVRARVGGTIVRDHRGGRIRDHREGRPIVRDHREGRPIVRDHREGRPDVRDHRRPGVPEREAPTPPEPLFRETDRVIDLSLPFTFDPALHRYVFEGVGAMAPGVSQGLVRRQISWNGRSHVYYQDDGERNVFFYVPDTFKIARRPEAPHEPVLSVRFDSADGSREQMQVTCTYCAVPAVNRERLASALQEMQALVPADVLAASGGIALEPLLPDPAKIRLKLAFPGADTTGGPFALRPQATVDLRAGIVDGLTLSLDQFRALYDALFDEGQLFFSGSVAFEMGGTGEEIPFQLRMHDTAEPFAAWAGPAAAGGREVSVTNEIESVLRVRHLDAIVEDVAGATVLPLEPTEGAYPVDIAPAATARFQAGDGIAGAIAALDFSDVETVPDKEAVYEQIVDPSTPPQYLRPIKVRTFAQAFAAPADPQAQVMAIVVDFEDGTTVELTPEALDASVEVAVPLTSFILGAELSQAYRYKVTVGRLNGTTADAEWRTGESGVLFPSIA